MDQTRKKQVVKTIAKAMGFSDRFASPDSYWLSFVDQLAKTDPNAWFAVFHWVDEKGCTWIYKDKQTILNAPDKSWGIDHVGDDFLWGFLFCVARAIEEDKLK